MPPTLEKTVSLPVQEAYAKLRKLLVDNGCKVLSEAEPVKLQVKQGSLWGISAKKAKKTINFNLEQSTESTKIQATSTLSSDWKNITFIGCGLAFVLAAICVWMALDLDAFMLSGKPSFWSWIITAGETVRFQAGEAFVNLAWGLAVFLVAVIVVEVVVLVHARSRINQSAEFILKQLS